MGLLHIENKELFSQIHPDKNNGVDLFSLATCSNKKIWWKCDKGHEWQAVINNRKRGDKCKKCSGHGISTMERTFFYYFQLIFKNAINTHKISYNDIKMEVDIFIPEINLAIEYDGIYYHEKDKRIENDIEKNKFLEKQCIPLLRIRECGLIKVHDVEFMFNYTQKQNSRTNLKATLFDILNYVVLNFEVNKDCLQRIQFVRDLDFDNHNIPKEFFIYPQKNNSLLLKNSALSKEWHPSLNGELTPEFVSYASHKEVWWICKENHIWKSPINNRSRLINSRGCPDCFSLYKRGRNK